MKLLKSILTWSFGGLKVKIDMFSVPLYFYQIDEWKIKKQKLINLLKETKITKDINVLTSFFSDSNSNIKKFEEIIREDLKKFYAEIGYDFSIIQYWFQIYEKQMSHNPHIHGPYGYSLVIFVDYDKKNHDPTSFLSPFTCSIRGIYETFCPERQVKEGTMILFPSNILHFVQRNESTKDRIICSANLKIVDKNNYFKSDNERKIWTTVAIDNSNKKYF